MFIRIAWNEFPFAPLNITLLRIAKAKKKPPSLQEVVSVIRTPMTFPL